LPNLQEQGPGPGGSRLTLTTAKEYGENEIRHLCNKLSLPFSGIKTEYREFKDKKGVASTLRALMNRAAVNVYTDANPNPYKTLNPNRRSLDIDVQSMFSSPQEN
jgi:hypothetical protein